jgi:hypothetical protein
VELVLQLPEDGEGFLALGRQLGTTALDASGRRGHERFACRLVDVLDHEPGVSIRYAQLPGGFADAAPAVDAFQQFQSALTKYCLAGALDPNAHADFPVGAP